MVWVINRDGRFCEGDESRFGLFGTQDKMSSTESHFGFGAGDRTTGASGSSRICDETIEMYQSAVPEASCAHSSTSDVPGILPCSKAESHLSQLFRFAEPPL